MRGRGGRVSMAPSMSPLAEYPMSLRLRPLAAALPLFFALADAQAASFTLYTSEAAYLAAVGATRAYTDFAGAPGANVSGGSFLPGVVTFGSCTDPANPGTCGTTVLSKKITISKAMALTMAGYKDALSNLALSVCWSCKSSANWVRTWPKLPPCSPALMTAV